MLACHLSLLDSLVRHCQVVPAPDVPTTDGFDLAPLMEVLDRVPDHRDRRGRRYRLGAVLALCLIAVLGGARSLVQICRRARSMDPAVWAAVGFTLAGEGRVRLPVATTLGRIVYPLAHGTGPMLSS